jgi:hypothetical protein
MLERSKASRSSSWAAAAAKPESFSSMLEREPVDEEDGIVEGFSERPSKALAMMVLEAGRAFASSLTAKKVYLKMQD